jgi:hypothetical protein
MLSLEKGQKITYTEMENKDKCEKDDKIDDTNGLEGEADADDKKGLKEFA